MACLWILQRCYHFLHLRHPATQTPSIAVAPTKCSTKIDGPPDYKPICIICSDEIEGLYSTPCLECKQVYCYDCVKRIFRTALKDMNSMPVKCCRTIIHHEVARGILPDGEFERYKMKMDEAGTINPLYCPVPTCSTFIPPRMFDVWAANVSCPSCSTIICTKCKQLASPTADHICVIDNVKQSILSFGYKTCPKCGTGLMKMFGCAHIRCHCGANWCWDCKKPILVCYGSPCRGSHEAEMEAMEEEGEDQFKEDDGDIEEPAPIPTERISGSSSQAVPMAEEGIPGPIGSSGGVGPSAAPTSNPDGTNNTSSRPMHVNLDDPEAVDWQDQDLDFGQEPHDEDIMDIWACQHDFSILAQNDLPMHWLVGVDPFNGRDIQVECMACFTKVKARRDMTISESQDAVMESEDTPVSSESGQIASTAQAKRKELEQCPTTSTTPVAGAGADDDDDTDTDPDPDPDPESDVVHKPKPRDAFVCDDCRVIYCQSCTMVSTAAKTLA